MDYGANQAGDRIRLVKSLFFWCFGDLAIRMPFGWRAKLGWLTQSGVGSMYCNTPPCTFLGRP